MKKESTISTIIDSTLYSYSQIFFSKNRVLAVLILFASFLYWEIGLWGLLGVLVTNGFAWILGFHKETMREGLFGLNSLLVVFGLAVYYEVNSQFILIFLATCLLTLFISVAVMHLLARLGLPFLSIPFLLSLWVMILAIRQYTALEPSEGTIYTLNRLFALGGTNLVNWYEQVNAWTIPGWISSYFKSLAAIIFQGNLFAGLLIAIGLFLHSRIAFTLTVLGYLTGYSFYLFVGADMSQLHYTYIGFNFILSAVAIGGFFYIANWKAYSMVILTAPIIAMLIAASSALLLPLQLPVYSLPFVVIVLLIIYILNFSSRQDHFIKVVHQQYSPERNLYAFKNYLQRFGGRSWFHIGLPFFGEWTISQGHQGKHTHKGDWQHAWDFVIQDEKGNTWRDPGEAPEHFYCYNLPAIAPAAGYVMEIVDNVLDNPIGEVNIQRNWGNTIVIKHAENLFTKISHLKAGTFKVKKGDYVKKGDVLAHLGNSGRSPEPHLHFQVQTTPYVGSKTLKYPIAYYMEKTENGVTFKEFEYPDEKQTILSVKTNPLLKSVFSLVPGRELKFEVEENGKIHEVRWEVFTNTLNQTYIYCHTSGAHAYFVHDDTLFYFTSFEGNKQSLLYYFHLGAYKILLSYYKDLELEDSIPLYQIETGIKRYLQDSLAALWVYKKVEYSLSYQYIDNAVRANEIRLSSKIKKKRFNKTIEQIDFNWIFKSGKIDSMKVSMPGKEIMARQIG